MRIAAMLTIQITSATHKKLATKPFVLLL